jgi:hypothetical protein
MSFSASTCITVGAGSLGPTLKLYSNPVSPTNMGVYIQDVSTSLISGANCPYTFQVPDGTTTVRVYDPSIYCYVDFEVLDNNLCTTCDLNFNTFTSPSIGNIIAGDITGSCDASISNYLIKWYDVTNPLTPIYKFSSGKGTMFQPYDKIHPLTGTSSVLATSGTYEARLDKVDINGLVFSISGESGTILAELDCLSTFDIQALTCDNGGTSDLPQYTHKFNYSATTGGNIPDPLSTTFRLSAGTKYFPWRFKGFSVPDKIKLTLSGTAYPVPITLEYWEVGTLTNNNYNPTSFPKSANTSTEFFSKITTLTGMTINEGDNIFIEITPSTTNNQTSWTFYCGCIESVNSNICIPPPLAYSGGQITYTFPIIESSINMSAGTCNIYPTFHLSGCSMDSITATTIYQHTGKFNNNAGFGQGSSDLIKFGNGGSWSAGNIYLNQVVCGTGQLSRAQTCANLGPSYYVTYEKTSGLFKITSNSLSPISEYYSDYKSVVTPYVTSFSGDNTNVQYYRHFALNNTKVTGTTSCGDGTPESNVYIHISSVVTTGTTGSDYYIEFTMPTISTGITYTSCSTNCTSSMNSIVSVVNAHATGTSYNYTSTSNNGSYKIQPVRLVSYFTEQPPASVTGVTAVGGWYLEFTQNETIPASGSSYTIIPGLSALTYPDLSNITDYVIGNTAINHQLNYLYEWSFFDSTNLTTLSQNYRLFASRLLLTGKQSSPTFKEMVYEVTNGVVTYKNTNFII